MKLLFSSLIILSFFSINAHSIETKDVEMFGYARAGVGTNSYGGNQECFYNQDSGGWGGIGRNEFRLGNECSNYLELAFKFNHVKTETQKVFTQFRLANKHAGQDSTEQTTQETRFVEAFAEIQGMNNLPWNFWVGKKFYRDQDVFIDDYYYFGSMSGNGGGVGNIDLLGGKLSVAYLRKVSDTRTNIGLPAVTVYDVRLKELKLTNSIKQNYWIAYGSAPASVSTTGENYSKTQGFVLGTLFDMDLNGKGFNHLAIMIGQGVMNNFNLYGSSMVSNINQQNNKTQLRLINHTTIDLSDKWMLHASVNHERLLINSNTNKQWLGAGIRPIYKVTPNFHLVTEVGSSIVQNEGAKKLTRLTFAPQLSINDNIWGRPVLRAFYTHSFWSKNNKSNVAIDAPTYADKIHGGSYGLQMESFF